MKKHIFIMISILTVLAVILCGCSVFKTVGNSETETEVSENGSTASSELFTSRDLSGEIDTENAETITLSGDTAVSSADGVSISGGTVKIAKEGTYILSGTLNDGSVIVDVADEEKVQLVLNGVSITSKTFAPIYVINADKVFITLASGTENTLVNGGEFKQIDDNNVDAVIFSKDDITLNGAGTLNITSPAGHGIVGKDDLKITGGTYNITSKKTAIRGNDSVLIANGTFTITADTDGLHAENNDDNTVGNIYIENGTFNIKAGDDGVHATTTLEINGGTFNITAAEGLEATVVKINGGTLKIEASDDGINAAKKSNAMTPEVIINGGEITIKMGQGDTDGIDSNGNITINGGTVSVTGNSAFDYDGTGVINGGTVIVNGNEVTTLPNQVFGGGPGGNAGPGGNGGFAPGSNSGQGGNMAPGASKGFKEQRG